MAAADERICLMAGATAGRRLAVFLLQLLSHEMSRRGRNDQTHQVPLELSQSDLAEWVGVSRETVERVLSGWVGRGIVRTGRRSLLVLNIAHLQRIAGLRPHATGHAA
jgi:CRP-like cAMP-binding protein